MNICYSCLSNSGEKRISPGKTIFIGSYWIVEHAYPTGLLGWIVIVLKRHCEELHNLTLEEWKELAFIQFQCIKGLNSLLHSEKEYCSCFAEMEGFKHIHFHIIPKTSNFNNEYKGTKSFYYLKVENDKCISNEEISKLCDLLSSTFE